MKYIKLTPEFIKDVTAHDEVCDYILFSNEFWQGFIKAYPQHIVESVPTENKEREELLMVASRIWAGHLTNENALVTQYTFTDAVNDAIGIRNAVNAACEKKEDSK